MKIIGLGHYSRTGKDSFANYLVKSLYEHDPTLRVKKIPFAWKLKQICYELYAWAGMREPEFYDTLEGAPLRDIVLPGIGKTPVQIWVQMGTPAIRDIVYDRTWIDYLFKNDQQLDVLIAPDVRFPNESEATLDAGGKLIKIVRPGYGPRNTVADRALLGWDGWHYVFGSSGRMAELEAKAAQVAVWLVHGCCPIQTASERAEALSVEKI